VYRFQGTILLYSEYGACGRRTTARAPVAKQADRLEDVRLPVPARSGLHGAVPIRRTWLSTRSTASAHVLSSETLRVDSTDGLSAEYEGGLNQNNQKKKAP